MNLVIFFAYVVPIIVTFAVGSVISWEIYKVISWLGIALFVTTFIITIGMGIRRHYSLKETSQNWRNEKK